MQQIEFFAAKIQRQLNMWFTGETMMKKTVLQIKVKSCCLHVWLLNTSSALQKLSGHPLLYIDNVTGYLSDLN